VGHKTEVLAVQIDFNARHLLVGRSLNFNFPLTGQAMHFLGKLIFTNTFFLEL